MVGLEYQTLKSFSSQQCYIHLYFVYFGYFNSNFLPKLFFKAFNFLHEQFFNRVKILFSMEEEYYYG